MRRFRFAALLLGALAIGCSGEAEPGGEQKDRASQQDATGSEQTGEGVGGPEGADGTGATGGATGGGGTGADGGDGGQVTD